MTKVMVVVLLLVAVVYKSALAAAGAPFLQTVPRVDLARYMGNWHEIARLEHRFQMSKLWYGE